MSDQPEASVGDLPTYAGEAPPPSTRTLPPADAPPGYALDRELGRGGMGVVYLAHQTRLNRPVALKMILSGDHAHARERARFLAEAEAVAAVKHPNVVQVHELGEHAGRPFLALEYCPGGSLADRLADGTPLPPAAAAALVAKLADAVQAVHDVGTVHRDLKPANVLLDASGEPKVTDFGLAKRGGGSEMTRTGAVMGTPAYMAPEQARGDTKLAGPAADVYALGVILFECLTGRRPFDGADPVGLLVKVATEDAPPARRVRPGVPADLELVAAKCLSKHPRERYGTAAGLADELRRFLRGEPVEVRPLGRRERLGRWVRKNRTLAAAVAVVAAALVVGAGAATVSALEARKAARVAAAEADRARAAEAAAEAEADRARRAEAAAAAAEGEQRRLADDARRATARVFLASADAAVRADDLAGSLPFLAQAAQTDPALPDLRVNAVLSGLPKVVGFARHPGPVAHLAVSPDGRHLASAGADGSVRLWDLATAVPGPPVAFPGPVFALAFRPDGRELAACGGTFLKPGAVLRVRVPDGTPAGPPRPVDGTPMAVGYTRSGRLATAEMLAPGMFQMLRGEHPRAGFRVGGAPGVLARTLWAEPGVQWNGPKLAAPAGRVLDYSGDAAVVLNLFDGKPVGRFRDPGPRPRFAELSADGRYVVSVDDAPVGREAKAWDLDADAGVVIPLSTQQPVRAAAVDAGGRLALVFADGELRRFALADGRPLDGGPLPGGPAGVEDGAVFSPDGQFVALLGRGNTVRAVRAVDRKLTAAPLPHGAAVDPPGVRFLAGGRRLAVGAADGTVRVWDLSPGEKPRFRVGLSLPGEDLRFRPDGQFVVAGAANQWAADPDKPTFDNGYVTVKPSDDAAGGTHPTPDGKLLLVRGERVVRLVEPGSGKEVGRLPHLAPQVLGVAVSADGRFAATADALGGSKFAAVMGNLQVWDVPARKRVLGPLTGPQADAGPEPEVNTEIAVHHSPPRLAVGRADLGGGIRGLVRLYDLATGKPTGKPLPVGPQMGVDGLAFSPDGTRLAVTARKFPSGGGEVAVWDLASAAPVVPPFLCGEVRPPVWSPDGRRVAAAAGTKLLLFDTQAADRPPVELDHPDGVQFARFVAGGAYLLAAANDKLYLYDPAGGLVRPPFTHPSTVRSADLSADGRDLVAAGWNHQVVGWRLTDGRRPADAVERLGRLLSARQLLAVGTGRATADTLEADFRHLKRHHPAEVTATPDEMAGWHYRQSDAAAAARDFAAAGRQCEAVWPVLPDDDNCRFNAGAYHLRAGDRAGVRRAAGAFATFVRNNGDKPYLSNLVRHVEFGLTIPDLLAGPERAAALASGKRLTALTGKPQAFVALATALYYTRAGDLDAAAELIERVRTASDAGAARARADAQLAVVRRLQRRPAEAEKLAAVAAAALTRWDATIWTEWHAVGFLRHLIAEARQPVPQGETP